MSYPVNTLFLLFTTVSPIHVGARSPVNYQLISLPPPKCIETPHNRIRRTEPFASYTPDLLRGFFRAVDSLAGYANTLGVVVANETLTMPGSAKSGAAAVVRAAVRDVRRYVRLLATASEDEERSDPGQNPSRKPRVLPIGVNCADVVDLQRPQFDYYTAALPEDEDDYGPIDFFAVCSTPLRIQDPIFFSYED